MTGADTLAVVVLRGRLVVMVSPILDRPRRLLRARMCRVQRQPGKAGGGEKQQQRCQAGAEAEETHGCECSYEIRGGKGFIPKGSLAL